MYAMTKNGYDAWLFNGNKGTYQEFTQQCKDQEGIQEILTVLDIQGIESIRIDLIECILKMDMDTVTNMYAIVSHMGETKA